MKIETDYTKWYVDGLESFEKKSEPKIITTKTGFAQQNSDIQKKVNNDKTDIDTKIVIGPSTQIEKNKKKQKNYSSSIDLYNHNSRNSCFRFVCKNSYF